MRNKYTIEFLHSLGIDEKDVLEEGFDSLGYYTHVYKDDHLNQVTIVDGVRFKRFVPWASADIGRQALEARAKDGWGLKNFEEN